MHDHTSETNWIGTIAGGGNILILDVDHLSDVAARQAPTADTVAQYGYGHTAPGEAPR